MPTRNTRRRKQRGQSLVETAFVVVATTLLIVGIVDAGRFVVELHYLKDRARSVARWAATHTDDAALIKNYAAYGTTAGGTGPGIMGLTPSNVSVTLANKNTPQETITVALSKTIPMLTPGIPDVTLSRAVATSQAESLGSTE